MCVTSQSVCDLNYKFCLTVRTGLKRPLSHAEMVDEVVLAKRLFESSCGNFDGNCDTGNTGQKPQLCLTVILISTQSPI